MNSETVSEKRERGRPRLLAPADLALLRYLSPDATTVRTLHNVHYRQRGLSAVMAFIEHHPELEPRLRVLFDAHATEHNIGSQRKRWKPTVLAELGRIPDLLVMRDVALDIADKLADGMTVHEAVAVLRFVRKIMANDSPATKGR
ncbi:MAG: hypothetical protein WD066_17695 [Planctomycetaceae bacterium]